MAFFKIPKRKPRIDVGQFPEIILEMARRLEAQREQYMFAVYSAFKSEGIAVSGASGLIEDGTPVDSALRAFQLVSVVGFSWEYMDPSNWRSFDEQLTTALNNGREDTISTFREEFLDCEGDLDRLISALAEEVHNSWGRPEPEARVLNGLKAGAHAFCIMSQASAAAALGDSKREMKLRRQIPFP